MMELKNVPHHTRLDFPNVFLEMRYGSKVRIYCNIITIVWFYLIDVYVILNFECSSANELKATVYSYYCQTHIYYKCLGNWHCKSHFRRIK